MRHMSKKVDAGSDSEVNIKLNPETESTSSVFIIHSGPGWRPIKDDAANQETDSQQNVTLVLRLRKYPALNPDDFIMKGFDKNFNNSYLD